MIRPAKPRKVRRRAASIAASLLVIGLVAAPAARTSVVAAGLGSNRVTASDAHHPAGASSGGTVTLVTNGSAADLDSATNELASSDVVVRNIYEDLITFAGTSISKYRGVLATSWQVKNGGKTYIFHLRHGVKFHTGREMTAQDVQYSLARTMLAKLTNSYLLSRFITNPNKQIRATGKYTVEFDLGKPQQFFLPSLANEYVCLILDSHALKAHVKKNDFGHAYASTHDLGTGPYTIQTWQRSQQVVLKKFPGYWGGWKGAHFNKVVISTVPESSTRRELLEKGQADLTFQLTPSDYQAMKSNPKLRVVAPYGTELDYITMTQYGPLAKPAARQAMSYAFNYNAALSVALKGFGRRAYGPIPSVMLGFDPHAFHYQTNLAKAKALFKKAGVKQGTTLTYAYSPTPLNDASGKILQAQLAQIGITLKLQQLDEAAFNSIFYGSEPAKQRPNLMHFSWWPDYNDPYDMANILLNSAAGGANGANAGFYHNKKLDALLAKMQNDGRAALIKDARTMQDIVGRQDPPSIWVAEPAEVTVMAKSLKGFSFNPLSIQTYDFYQLHR